MHSILRVWMIPVLVACVVSTALAADDKPKTLAYDGFATGGGGGTYRNHIRLVASGGPTAEVIGFDVANGWGGSTSHFLSRFGRQLKHNLLEKVSVGSLGHMTFNGHRAVGRMLPGAPAAASGVYTLCLLYKAHPNPISTSKGKDGHPTNFEGKYAMIGFTSGSEGIDGGARGGNNGKDGLSLGYFEDDLRVFAGTKSFSIVEQYKVDATYLLMAEMTVSKDGPEYIRGFYAIEGEKELTPAAFNKENDGKGVQVETWSTPADLIRLEIYTQDPAIFPPQASHNDGEKLDFITWDEVRLMDGKAVAPVPHIAAEGAMVAPDELLKARPTLPEKLAGYWAFDEGAGNTAKDAAGGADAATVRTTWIDDGALGKALRFTAKLGPKYGPHEASAVTIPHEAVIKAGFPWERHHKFTYSAWVRGTEDFKGGADIITKANGAKAAERIFADIKGIAFMVSGNKLELELVNSINFPQPDMRIKVHSKLDVPGDGKWHHVAVTYDGSCKPAGITFYVDGVKDDGFSFNFADLPNQPKELIQDIGVLSPYCFGGRDCKDDKDGWSMRGASYAMVGDLDEVGIFSYTVTPGAAIALHSLATTEALKYGLGQVNQLIELHRAKKGPVQIGDKTWEYATDLKGDLGKVAKDGGAMSIKLADDGTGVRTK